MKDTVFTKTLELKNGKLLRTVPVIDDFEKIIDIIKKKELMGSHVVNTQIHSKEKHLIEHEFINYIIHSGEYTESMGYDVQRYALELALDFFKEKVYGWDLLPHNFTYKKGNWFLYDFDSFSLNPKRIITQLRGYFKITFSNFEILRQLTRSEMSYYYLTRVRIEDIIKLIPFHRWLYLSFNMIYCQILLYSNQYEAVYKFLLNLFDKYTKNYKKEYYQYTITEEEKSLFETINNELKNNYKSIFCIGEESAKWAIYSEEKNSDVEKFAYIDDYILCDKYYNYINQNKLNDISTAVLYPLVDDEIIDKNLKYRALYDTYAQYRFYSDAVLSLENDDVEALMNFTSNILIVKSENNLDEKLRDSFNFVLKIGKLYIAKDKKNKTRITPTSQYEDGNRGPDAHRQTWEILKILKKKNKNK